MEENGFNAALLFLGCLSVSSADAGKFTFTCVFIVINKLGNRLPVNISFDMGFLTAYVSSNTVSSNGRYAKLLCVAFMKQYNRRRYFGV